VTPARRVNQGGAKAEAPREHFPFPLACRQGTCRPEAAIAWPPRL